MRRPYECGGQIPVGAGHAPPAPHKPVRSNATDVSASSLFKESSEAFLN